MFQFFRKKLNKKGFTLIELIVVIAILGILAAIAIPSYSKYKDNAATAALQATAKSVYDAVLVADTANELDETTATDVTGWEDYVDVGDASVTVSVDEGEYTVIASDDDSHSATYPIPETTAGG